MDITRVEGSLDHIRCVFIDAMGVLYRTADDVSDLLIPFCREKGSVRGERDLRNLYQECSLGKYSSEEFWAKNGFSKNYDVEYVSLQGLNDEVLETLAPLSRCYDLFCLSNDVSEWSALLRRRFRLEEYFKGWIISGDVATRKPDPRIYEIALKRAGQRSEDCLLIDDNLQNLKAAQGLGIRVAWFGKGLNDQAQEVPHIKCFSEIKNLLEE